MQTLFKRNVTVDGKHVIRNVTIKAGQATIQHKNQKVQVTPSGDYRNRETKWTTQV